jgi:hypothetical protein
MNWTDTLSGEQIADSEIIDWTRMTAAVLGGSPSSAVTTEQPHQVTSPRSAPAHGA